MTDALPTTPSVPDKTPPKRNFSEDQIKERMTQVKTVHEEIKTVGKQALEIFTNLLDFLVNKKITQVPEEAERLQRKIEALEKVIGIIRSAAANSESKKPQEYAKTVIDCIGEIIAFGTEHTDAEIKDYLAQKNTYLQGYVRQVTIAQQKDPDVSGPLTALKVRENKLFDHFGEAYSDADAELGRLPEVESIPHETRKLLMALLNNCRVMSKKSDVLKKGSAAQLVEDYGDIDEYDKDLTKLYNDSLQVNVLFDEEEVRKQFRMKKTSIVESGNKDMVKEHTSSEGSIVRGSPHLGRIVDDILQTNREEEGAVKKARKEAEETAANSIPDLKALRQEINRLDGMKKEIRDLLMIVAGTSNKIQRLLKNVGLEKGDKELPDNLGNTQMIDLLKNVDEVETGEQLKELQEDEIGNDPIEGLAPKFGKANVIGRIARKAQQVFLAEEAAKKGGTPPRGGEAAATEATPAETSTAVEPTPETDVVTDNPEETRPPGYGEALPPVPPAQTAEDVAGTEEFDLDNEEEDEEADQEHMEDVGEDDEDEESEDDDKDETDPKAPKA